VACQGKHENPSGLLWVDVIYAVVALWLLLPLLLAYRKIVR